MKTKASPHGSPWFVGTIAVAMLPKDTITVLSVEKFLMPDSTKEGSLSNKEWLKEEFAQVGVWDHRTLRGAPTKPGVYRGTVFAWFDAGGFDMEPDSGFTWGPAP